MSYQIRQLGLGGILDQAIRLLKDNFGLLLGIALVLEIPFTVIQGYVTDPADAAVEGEVAEEDEDLVAVQQFRANQTPQGLLMLFLNSYLIVPITNAAMVFAIAGKYLDQPVSIGQAYKQALARILGLLWTWFLVGMAIMGGMFLCIVPGILAAFWFGLATQVVVIEGTSGFPALKRSRALMKGNIANLFVLGLLIGAISVGIIVGAAVIPQRDLRIVGSAVAQGVTTILGAAVIVVFYFSARCQHEHFDLTLLAQAVGADSPPPDAEPDPGA